MTEIIDLERLKDGRTIFRADFATHIGLFPIVSNLIRDGHLPEDLYLKLDGINPYTVGYHGALHGQPELLAHRDLILSDLITHYSEPEKLMPETQQLLTQPLPDAALCGQGLISPDQDQRTAMHESFEYAYYDLLDLRRAAIEQTFAGESLRKIAYSDGQVATRYTKEQEARRDVTLKASQKSWLKLLAGIHPEWFENYTSVAINTGWSKRETNDIPRRIAHYAIVSDPTVFDFYDRARNNEIPGVTEPQRKILARLLLDEHPEVIDGVVR